MTRRMLFPLVAAPALAWPTRGRAQDTPKPEATKPEAAPSAGARPRPCASSS